MKTYTFLRSNIAELRIMLSMCEMPTFPPFSSLMMTRRRDDAIPFSHTVLNARSEPAGRSNVHIRHDLPVRVEAMAASSRASSAAIVARLHASGGGGGGATHHPLPPTPRPSLCE